MLRHGELVKTSEELIGFKYNQLTIIKEVDKNRFGHRKVLAICDCGIEKEYVLFKLRSGHTQSCGCWQQKMASSSTKIHGLTKHKLYSIWNNIKWRCYNPKCPAYKNYGAIGIIMCEEWRKSFFVFYDWCITNGWKEGMEIDKDIKPKKLGILPFIYSPEWCSVVTRTENTNSRRNNVIIEFNSDKKTLSEWARIYKKKPSLISQRIVRGKWSIERALTQ